MFLHNAYAGFNYAELGVSVNGTYGEKGNTVTKYFNGNNGNTNKFSPLQNFGVPKSNATATFMWVGTGTTEPQLLDCTIPNKCPYSESGLYVANASNGNVVYDAENNKFTRTNTTLIHNNGTTDVIVTEIYLVSTSTSFSGSQIVWYKELLDTSITVGAGKYLEISFTGEIKDGVMSANTGI